MKKALLTIILFYSYFCQAQNYQCLQSGVQHYFINGNGYLRGIRIESIKAISDTTVYYPFHTPRGSYSSAIPFVYPDLDPNGGSWLGKRVLQLSDGTFIFDSYWNDSVIVKTQASIGDSWGFYSDSSSLYYKATLVSKDTMTVLSSLDSVETIMINAYNGSGIVTSDPLDSFTIILSKNNGFVQVFDLYTFPYHLPDSAYTSGLDFFLDRSTCYYSNINSANGSSPDANITLFKLVNFINPTEQQLSNWDIGDIIESDNELGIPIYSTVTVTRLDDTVVDKTVSGDLINYTISGSTYNCPSSFTSYPCSLICKAGMYSFSDLVYPLMDTFEMPEEASYHGNYLFYYPTDSNYCSQSPAYISVPQSYYPWGLGWTIENISYKLGIGKTIYHYADGNPTYETDRLLYYNIAGISCGTPLPTRLNNVSVPSNQIDIYPNPATTELTITASDMITSLSINNLLGQTVYSEECNMQQVQVDVSSLPAGMYFVKINGSEVRKFCKTPKP
jgi:hypothetical protein